MQREAFGKLLIILRKKNGLSQKELAERLSVSTSAVSKWLALTLSVANNPADNFIVNTGTIKSEKLSPNKILLILLFAFIKYLQSAKYVLQTISSISTRQSSLLYLFFLLDNSYLPQLSL